MLRILENLRFLSGKSLRDVDVFIQYLRWKEQKGGAADGPDA
jgi:hypothetical protein